MYTLEPKDFDFLKRAKEVATESGCIHSGTRFGAIAVKDGKVLSEGFNGAVGKIPLCTRVGKCIRQEMKIAPGEKREFANCICAEQRVICNAARSGTALEGATLYVTGLPCAFCIRLLIAAGFVRVIYEKDYPSPMSHELAELGGLELVKVEF
ncbi:MAG: deaminase [Firmicutes bacterium]|nr:deaminase [Bacillota bacterium]